MKRFNFNLVEIMLAVVILTLGMTSVFVLFPAGLSNHRTAMAENSVADLAEFIISRVRAEAALSSNEDKFIYDKFNSGPDKNTYQFDEADDTLKEIAKGVYLVSHMSGPDNDYADFAAVAQVYNDPTIGDEIWIPQNQAAPPKVDKYAPAPGTVTLKALDVYNFVLPMVLEISYPSNIPYDDREFVYFRFEIYNDNFELKKQVMP